MAKQSQHLLRWLPLIILATGLFLFFYFRLFDYLTFTELAKQRLTLAQWTDQHYMLTVLGFMAVYILAVAFSFPGATILTLAGGFLFGVTLGTVYVVVAATTGAAIIFIAVKTSLGKMFAKKSTKWLKKLEQGFADDAFNYLLVLRFVPIFPFWVINIAAGLLGVRLRTFVLATFMGIIPGSLVYVAVGSGLDAIFEHGKTPDLSIIFQPSIILPLLGLSLLSLVPVIYKKIKAKKHA
jgi:uncharacterized membrane protein YdjX (TVP38/TMEM64 family)